MNIALLVLSFMACFALLIYFLIAQRNDPHFDNRVGASFSFVACVIPPLVHNLVNFDSWEGIFFWCIVFALALSSLYLVTRKKLNFWEITLGVQGFWVLAAIVLVSLACSFSLKYPVIYWFCWLAIFFGTLVGAAEIFSRYQDEPLDALLSSAGIMYQAINGAIAAAAYGLLREYREKLIPALMDDLLLTSMVAGFGAMAIMRSKFFSYKSANGEDIAFGPDIVISFFLQSVDRAIDRARALKRRRLVFDSIKDIVYSDKVPFFFIGNLASFQNLSPPQKTAAINDITTIATNQSLAPQLKLMAMAFGFLNISGEKNYDQLAANLKEFLRLPAPTATALTALVPVPSPGAAAAPVTLSATVSSPSGTVNEGSVTFSLLDAAGMLVGAPKTSTTVSGGSVSVVYDLPANTPRGAYTIRAVYNHTPYLSGSATTSILTVN